MFYSPKKVFDGVKAKYTLSQFARNSNKQKNLRCEIDFSPIENLAKFSFIQKIPREKTALTSRQIDQKYNGPTKFDVFHFELDFGETK